MKTILVLTNFSKNSRNAAEAAVEIADKTGGANILLFHAALDAPFVPGATVAPWPWVKIKEEYIRLREYIAHGNFAAEKITVNYLSGAGELGENVQKLLRGREVLLTIMGGRENRSGKDRFGSAINNVLDKVNYPVLIVNHNKPDLSLKNVTFATGIELEDIDAIHYLTGLARSLHFHLNICHVCASPVFLPDFNEEDKIARFINTISKMSFSNISYHNLEGNNVIKALEDFNKKTHSGMLAIVHRKHSLFWQLFHKNPSKTLLKQQHSPLLILPERWEKKGSSFSRHKILFTNPRLQFL
jgi:nucleotide-binding universal stress UspA family protein